MYTRSCPLHIPIIRRSLLLDFAGSWNLRELQTRVSLWRKQQVSHLLFIEYLNMHPGYIQVMDWSLMLAYTLHFSIDFRWWRWLFSRALVVFTQVTHVYQLSLNRYMGRSAEYLFFQDFSMIITKKNADLGSNCLLSITSLTPSNEWWLEVFYRPMYSSNTTKHAQLNCAL